MAILDEAYAHELDFQDSLKEMRTQFHLPFGGKVVYLCGNSLGLQPKSAREAVQKELDVWAWEGVEGHFGEDGGWYKFHERFRKPMGKLLGCLDSEVVVMNSLTVNLHLLMVSFYKPTNERHIILMENKAFPSDDYAVDSQVQLRGFDPKVSVVRLGDEHGRLTEEVIEDYLNTNGSQVALIWLGAVNFYTGRVMDMERVARAGHASGAVVGFDLAHATGNVPLNLHDWNVDFAVFCTYKYLNGGAGGPGGAFVHSSHTANTSIHRLAGWWGNDPSTRFEMRSGFEPVASADGWQLSNAPIMGMSALYASVMLFDSLNFADLREKSLKLGGYLMDLITESRFEGIEVLTPRDSKHRGCQISVRVCAGTKTLLEVSHRLEMQGVLGDKRMPDVLRLSPVPLYNSYADVWRTVDALKLALDLSTPIPPSRIVDMPKFASRPVV
eukprot:c9690_g1_i2.p1 GENE.c9690_g1_i2~~c9690_g1_i2.p1  ORF type:complete len:462 (-),score=121.91 c9690_g1_i2:135-1457(-)